MSSRALRLTCLGIGLLGALGVTAAAQQLPFDLVIDPEVRGLLALEDLGDGIKAREPETVQGALGVLDANWAELSPKTAGKALKGVGKLFSRFKPRDEYLADGTTDLDGIQHCYRMAIGLVFDKDGGDKVLRNALKVPHIKTWPEVQANLLEGLGHRRDPEQLDFFADYLDHDEAPVMVAAAGALSRLSEADVSVRREAAEAVHEAFDKLRQRAEKAARKAKDDEETPAGTAFARIEYPFNDALRALTRQRFESVEDWGRWLSAEGRRDGW